MKPEKLQSLLYSFIENREPDDCDVVDGPLISHCSFAAAFDNPAPRPRYQSFQAESLVEPGGEWIQPVSPTELFPFVSTTPSPQEAAVGRTLSQIANNFSFAYPERSVVQFEEVCIVKEPKEQVLCIPVKRSQSCIDQETKVSWKTKDKTARSGIHYESSTGEIVFNKDDTQKTIDIKILDSSDDVNDLRFTLHLHHVGGLFDPSPLTISLKKIGVLYDNEKQVLNNLLHSRPFSIMDFRNSLEDCLTSRTFHMALTHLCSHGSTTDIQLALAFKLSCLCVKKMPGFFSSTLSGESVLSILTDFFRMDEVDF